MLAKRLIPSLLVAEGRLVKGIGYAGHRDAGNPATTARAHNAQGADELLLLDIGASTSGRGPDLEAVSSVASECLMPLTVGGGIGSLDAAHACMAAGADKLCLTSTALDDPDLVSQLAETFGSQAIMLGIDVIETKCGYRLYDHRAGAPAGDRDWLEWLREGVARGAGEIRLMAVSREGKRRGMDCALYDLAATVVNVPIILEGGSGTLEHLDDALRHGVDSVAVGTMLVFSDNNLVKVKAYLANCHHDMRIRR